MDPGAETWQSHGLKWGNCAVPARDARLPFWKTKSLEAMTAAEWESLCDGCARCCLNKIEDTETGEIHLTKVACSLLDVGTCRCSDYANRQTRMPDCIKIDPEKVRNLTWLPRSCGYRTVLEGRDLAWWHPLISGDPDTVHEAGISVRSFAKSERDVKPANIRRYLMKTYPRAKKRAVISER
jgi:hypothetical protein